ncbi:MAG TPA: hypothetical protein VK208_08145, partial [Pyrinomonadaceae bacterium]|nr:hypothetical protein [Pyrinomonadaceae bacterium]
LQMDSACWYKQRATSNVTPRQDQTVMKESIRQDFTLDDLDALRNSELRSQEMIFTQIGENSVYRPTLLTLLSNSLRQYSRLRREIK